MHTASYDIHAIEEVTHNNSAMNAILREHHVEVQANRRVPLSVVSEAASLQADEVMAAMDYRVRVAARRRISRAAYALAI